MGWGLKVTAAAVLLQGKWIEEEGEEAVLMEVSMACGNSEGKCTTLCSANHML